MLWLWTWGGSCFGYRQGDDLWARDGHFAGRFQRQHVFGRNGRYLGEIRGRNRLIVDHAKRGWRIGPVVVPPPRPAGPPPPPVAGLPLPFNCADFPAGAIAPGTHETEGGGG